MNAGTVTIHASGGPYELKSMGNFSDLWKAIESRGLEVPEKRPSILFRFLDSLSLIAFNLFKIAGAVLLFILSQIISVITLITNRGGKWQTEKIRSLTHGLLELQRSYQREALYYADAPTLDKARHVRARHPTVEVLESSANTDGYTYKGVRFHYSRFSNAGFYAFCEQFVLIDRNWTVWNYRVANVNRKYFPDGISEHVARAYLKMLREADILIPVPRRGMPDRLSNRINTIKDIKRAVSHFTETLSKAA
jgi:hypothetical protein